MIDDGCVVISSLAGSSTTSCKSISRRLKKWFDMTDGIKTSWELCLSTVIWLLLNQAWYFLHYTWSDHESLGQQHLMLLNQSRWKCNNTESHSQTAETYVSVFHRHNMLTGQWSSDELKSSLVFVKCLFTLLTSFPNFIFKFGSF